MTSLKFNSINFVVDATDSKIPEIVFDKQYHCLKFKSCLE